MATTRIFKSSIHYQGKKYTLSGKQHLRHSASMGKVEVLKINEHRTSQILPGMPEIHYTFTESHPFFVPDKTVKAVYTDKMDGTTILFSALDLMDGNTVVFARSRGMVPVQDTKWRPLESLVNESLTTEARKGIEFACLTQKATLVFELWGNRNRHTVGYTSPLHLSLHTMIKGKGTIQPWTRLAHIARVNGIETVDVIERVGQIQCTEDRLLSIGRNIVDAQETQNNPESGVYLHEGTILNIETATQGYQWKFKPPSMEEFHRVARSNICPVTVTHTLWKLIDDGKDISLDSVLAAMSEDYGEQAVCFNSTMIEHEYWAWMTREEQYFALIV